MIRIKLPWIKCTFCCLFIIARIRVFAQEYTYDPNCNLSGDLNKQIVSIHYNHLNLVDTIAYSDGRKMIYTYTATGQKLKEQSILSNGTSKQKRDYVAHILYRNDSLQEIKHEDGRSVPEQPGNANTTWEYQYHLTDHLGNVRSTLTSEPDVDMATATLETDHLTTEQNRFLRYDAARRINSVLFDHTKKGTSNFAQRLNGSANEKYGIAKSISVKPGDTLRLEAYAKYVDPNSNNWSQALTTMLTQIATGTAQAGNVVDGGQYATSGNTPFGLAGLNGTSGSSGSGPKAFLNWVIFDRNFVFKNGGYIKVSEAAKENGNNVPHERLAQELIIHEPGFVYVYISNEETTPVDVYFDDFSVTQIKSPVIQESDYDPFGLTFNEYLRENSAPNNFLYNGKELQMDFDLNWYDYGARMYDAALGRWHVIDPMAEKYAAWSPYNYVMNNPLRYIDPNGMEVNLPGETIYVSGKAPREEDDHRTKLLHAWYTLLSTSEGARIVRDANKKDAAIYIGLSKEDKLKRRNNSNVIGQTKRRGHKIIFDYATGRFRIVAETGSAYEMFNGIDVTAALAAGQEIILVPISSSKDYWITNASYLQKQYATASLIAHELEAHINIGVSDGLADDGTIDHILYGEAGPADAAILSPGSAADRLNKQLNALQNKNGFGTPTVQTREEYEVQLQNEMPELYRK